MRPILIVEDDDLNRALFEAFFDQLGYLSISAVNAADAIAQTRQHNPALIFMDWHLPGGVDGLAAATTIKSDPQLQHIPIIVTSAHYEYGLEQRVLAAGCAGFVRKPLDQRKLRSLIKTLLQHV